MFFPLVISALTACQPVTAPVQYCDSLVIEQTRAALRRVQAVERTCPPACTAVYEGTLTVEGHLMRPGMIYQCPVRLELTVDSGAGAVLIREVTGADRAAVTETTVVRGGRVVKQERAGAPFRELTADSGDELAAASCWLPALLVKGALEHAPSCRLGAAVGTDKAGELTPVSFPGAAGGVCTLLMNAHNQVVRVETLVADDRLGDVCNWTSFADWRGDEGAVLPGRIARFQVVKSATVRYELALASSEIGPVPASRFDLPAGLAGAVADWGVVKPSTGLQIVQIGGGLWSLEIVESDSRVLVIERDHDLVVLETPMSDALCRRIIDFLGRRFPGKPIGAAAFGHHHPASAGGLRAFAAAGVELVVPRVLEPFVRDTLARPTSLAPLAARGEAAQMDTFDGERTIDAGDATVRLIDIGEQSAHAFSYVVFYFPRLGLVFEGDLGHFLVEGPVRAGPRVAGLVGVMDRLGIKPERLVQAWPLKGVRAEVAWADIVAAVRTADERKRP